MKTKICKNCKKELPISFYCKAQTHDGRSNKCRVCRMKQATEYRHKMGWNKPLAIAKESPSWLGVHIAEEVLRLYFEDLEKLPYGQSGYDFVCKNNYKIDSKAGCLMKGGKGNPYWQFAIHQNKDADFFLCLGFDDREALNPLHLWLIPGKAVNKKKLIGITNTEKTLAKWEKWEKPIDKIIARCEELR